VLTMDILLKYFPSLNPKQIDQLTALEGVYREWNSMINVISRKDIDNLYLHHVLHSMAIAKWISFKPKSSILDLGCGGGFPGIPLAILFPEVQFHMVDSVAKKLKVVDAVAESIGLSNIRTTHSRVEELKSQYDFILTRAVAKAPQLLSWIRNKAKERQINAVPNGLIALKGGAIYDEMKPLKEKEYYEITPLSSYFEEGFYEEKFLVYVQL
jgi:16S rRNA (guanine527-N7)-methyltransferase